MRTAFDFGETSPRPRPPSDDNAPRRQQPQPQQQPLWAKWLVSFTSVFAAVLLALVVFAFGLRLYVEYKVTQFIESIHTNTKKQ